MIFIFYSQADSELTIDELKAKYQNLPPEEEEELDSDDDSMDEDDNSESEDELMDVDSEDPTEASIGENKEAEDVGLKNLLDDQASGGSADNCDNGDALLNNVAALAQSIQPKGNTLSSTSVVTPIPFLLKHTLREYQHIGLDWLVTMHDRKLNGILADEVGIN